MRACARFVSFHSERFAQITQAHVVDSLKCSACIGLRHFELAGKAFDHPERRTHPVNMHAEVEKDLVRGLVEPKNAVTKLNGTDLNGKKIAVEEAKPLNRDSRPSGGGGGGGWGGGNRGPRRDFGQRF